VKITATVHQLQLTREDSDYLNKVGRAEATANSPKHRAREETLHEGFQPEHWMYFSKQGEITIELTVDSDAIQKVLEDIFQAGNDSGYGPLAPEYHRYTHAYSISVGDIIILGEGAWRVDSAGFSQVELPRQDLTLGDIDARLGHGFNH
jgi:hypothetical protein